MNTTTADYGCRLATTVPYQTYGYPHYDGALNLLTRVDSTHGNAKDSATFAVGDRVVSWLGASYTYDADGNRATRTVGSTVTTYTWDASGRLLQVKTGTDSVTYAYNALGDLARRSTRGRVDRWFIWEEGQLLEELDSTAQHRVNAFAYRPGTDQPLARITGDAASTIEFVQQDGRGDVIGLTTGANMTQHVLYGAWGDVEAVSGDSLPQTRLGWKGLVWEGGTAQLYYVRSRWYDPQSGSFLSEDPLGLGGGRNTYAYADNDPVNGWDPSGLTMDDPGCFFTAVWKYFLDTGFMVNGTLRIIGMTPECTKPAGGQAGGRGSGGGTGGSRKAASGSQRTHKCGPITPFVHSGGVSYGANVDFGNGFAGLTATASAGAGLFHDQNTGFSVGGFAEGGAAGYTGPQATGSPVQQGQPVVIGKYAGIGPSLWVSNATSVQQLSGPFSTWTFNVGVGPVKGSLQLSYADGIWALSYGPPVPYVSVSTVGVSFDKLTTTTVTTTSGCTP